MAGNLTAMIASIFSGSAVTADPYYEYTTLLLPGNGTNGAQNNTFLDGSTNNFTITRNGNTTQGTFSPFSQTGWGNYFDGSGDYLTAASNAAFTLDSTGDFTVECWIYPTAAFPSTPTAPAYILASQSDYNTGYLNRWALVGTGSTIGWFNSAGSYGIQTSSLSLLNTWTHIAVVRSGSTITMYINGTSVGTQTLSQAYTTQSGAYIGFIPNASAFTGYISNARVVKGTAVYTSNFTPPTTPLTAISGTSLLTCQSNRFRDASTNNFTITVNGNTSVQAFSPFNPTSSWSATTNGGSGYFDGSGDYLTAPANAAFTLGTGAFTIEGWLYYQGSASGYGGAIINNLATSTDTAFLFHVYNGAVRFQGYNTVFLQGGAITSNSWVHCVVVRNSSNVMSMFLNGVRSVTATVSQDFSYSGTMYVGRDQVASANITGYLADVRIVKGTAVYDPTQTTLTVPTAPLTNITNTSLLLNFTNAGIYDATSKNDLETVGNAQISTTQSKWGGSSMAFDGTGDWLLNQAPIPPTTFGSADFSIEMWIYATTSGTQRWLFDGRIATPADGAYPAIYISSGNVLVYYVSAAARITGTTTISTGTWYFVQVIRTSGTTKMYLNGTQEGSNYTDSTVYLNPGVARPIIGAATNLVQPFTGYIQDLRVTNGYARPTTTPTAAFPTL